MRAHRQLERLCVAVGRDLDAVDQQVQQVLDRCRHAVVDGGAEQFADGFEPVARGQVRRVGHGLGGEFVAAVDEVPALLGQFLDAGSADLLGHVAGFEGAQVAVERGGLVADLGFDAGQLLSELGRVAVELGDSFADGPLEQVDVVVSVEQCVDHGPFECVGADPLGGAGPLAFGLAGEAGVVAVAAEPTVGADPDVGALAPGAAGQAAEQVVGLLVYRIDRLSRSIVGLMSVVEQLEQAGVALKSATEPIDSAVFDQIQQILIGSRRGRRATVR